jgi:hypothetical protein
MDATVHDPLIGRRPAGHASVSGDAPVIFFVFLPHSISLLALG